MEARLQNECIVSGTLGVVLRISQILGIASVTFENVSDGWRISVSRAANIYGKIFISFLAIIATSGVLWDVSNAREVSIHSGSASRAVLIIASVALTSTVLLAEVYYGTKRMDNLINCLARLHKINSELDKNLPLRSFEGYERFICGWSLIGVGIIELEDYCVLIYGVSRENLLKEILFLAFYLESFILKVLTVQLYLILRTVLHTFYHLNDSLESLLKEIKHQGANSTCSKTSPPKLRRIGFLYCYLCEIIRHTNEAHGLVLALLILSYLLHLIETPYTFITNMFGHTQDFYKSLVQVLWAMYHVMDLMMLIEPCHETYRQINRTKYLVSRLKHVTQPADYVFIAELEVFYKHLMYSEVVYAPMKMFKLNRALITTMFGSIITYLVIVIEH